MSNFWSGWSGWSPPLRASTGIAVVSLSNPFYSALALIGNLSSLAVLYLLAAAERRRRRSSSTRAP